MNSEITRRKIGGPVIGSHPTNLQEQEDIKDVELSAPVVPETMEEGIINGKREFYISPRFYPPGKKDTSHLSTKKFLDSRPNKRHQGGV